MNTPLLHHLPILPHLLSQLCLLSSNLDRLRIGMKVCLALGCFTMLRQSKLTPAPHKYFNPSHHACRGDILLDHPS